MNATISINCLTGLGIVQIYRIFGVWETLLMKALKMQGLIIMLTDCQTSDSKELWKKLEHLGLTNKTNQHEPVFTVDELNSYFASISTKPQERSFQGWVAGQRCR